MTALKAYADDEQPIVQIWGTNKPATPELHDWRDLGAGLPRAGVAV